MIGLMDLQAVQKVLNSTKCDDAAQGMSMPKLRRKLAKKYQRARSVHILKKQRQQP